MHCPKTNPNDLWETIHIIIKHDGANRFDGGRNSHDYLIFGNQSVCYTQTDEIIKATELQTNL